MVVGHGQAVPGFLGIHMSEAEGPGVRILQTVDGSPADKHLLAGDVILSVNGKPTRNTAQIAEVLGACKAGNPVKIHVMRDGGHNVYVLKLAVRPGKPDIVTTSPMRVIGKSAAVGSRVRVTQKVQSKMRFVEAIKAPRRLVRAHPVSPMPAGHHKKTIQDLHAKLTHLKAAAQKALAQNRFDVAAKTSHKAMEVAKHLEIAKKKLSDMIARQAMVYAKPLHPEAQQWAAKAKHHIAGIEKRLGALEKRLERMEHLLKRIAGADRR